jgi:hypothetical protein
MSGIVFVATRRPTGGLAALAEAVAGEPEGNRNHLLYWATIRAAEEGHDRDDIVDTMLDAAEHAGLTRRERSATLSSAVRYADQHDVWGTMAEPERLSPEWAKRAYEAWVAEGSPGYTPEQVSTEHQRDVVLTSAADIIPRRVRWLWHERLAMGSVSLIGGREGQGKTLLAIELAALITRGRLEGEHAGTPRSVIIVTTEDAWDYTIVPRLLAAGADLSLVFRAEARTADGVLTGLSLPYDFGALEQAIHEVKAALVILDPLLSRLNGNLDTHKDADVRLALEPLVALAERAGVHVIGLIHVNKTITTDPLTSLMASRAFAAVARAVLFVMKDPEEDGVRLLGQPKNNLGRTDMETLRFEVVPVEVGRDPQDNLPITAPKMQWLDSTVRTIEDALTIVAQGGKTASKRALAAEWLVHYLQAKPDGKAVPVDIITAAKSAGHNEATLRRARDEMADRNELLVSNEGFPKVTYWQLSARHIADAPEAMSA